MIPDEVIERETGVSLHNGDDTSALVRGFEAGAKWALKEAEDAIEALQERVKTEYGNYDSYAPEYEGLGDALEAIQALRTIEQPLSLDNR